MKVKELIEQLQKLDQELEVLVPGYEAHYDTAVIGKVIEFEPNVHEEWYYGSHDERKGGSAKGIVLERPNKA